MLAPPDRGVALDGAQATLQRGAAFLGRGPWADGPYRARLIGNGLRELDRFLNILIGEVAAVLGIATGRHERNTANALRRLRDTLGIADDDHARLTALGRSRDCLYYCGGVVRRGDTRGGNAMTSGWAEGADGLRRLPLGSALDVTQMQLAEACCYYAAIGDALVATCEGRRPG